VLSEDHFVKLQSRAATFCYSQVLQGDCKATVWHMCSHLRLPVRLSSSHSGWLSVSQAAVGLHMHALVTA
jgi:hypothetical protein